MKDDKLKKMNLIMFVHMFFDTTITLGSFIGAYYLKKYLLPEYIGGLAVAPNYYIVLLLIIIIWFICFYVFDLYKDFREKKFIQILTDLVKALITCMFILSTLMFVLKITDVSRILLGIFLILDFLFLIISKGIIHFVLLKNQQNEYNIKNILIIGSKRRAISFIDLINSKKSIYRIIGCIELNKSDIGKVVHHGVKVIGTMDDLKQILLTNVIDEVVFAMSLKHIENADEYMFLIEIFGKSIRILPDWHIHSLVYQPGIASIHFDDFIGMPTMILSPTSSKHRDLLIKTIIDYFVAINATIFLMPLIIFIMTAIKFVSKGPILYKQERVGLHGRKFNVYKFRTMVLNAEAKLKELQSLNEADGPVFKITKDPRIIPVVGTLLRKTSLDELPQLLNVLKGEMSLVGPRPPIQSEVNQYDIWQRRRLSMKPGLTCLWQIQPNRNDISFLKWMELDLEYIDNWSLKLDFSILFKTALVVLGAHGR